MVAPRLVRFHCVTRVAFCLSVLALAGCANTELIESPRTGYVADVGEARPPEIIWTTRNMDTPFEYLGQVKVRSWSYQGALDRLVEGGRQLRADAIVDVHFERIGFFKTMQAFAVKFR